MKHKDKTKEHEPTQTGGELRWSGRGGSLSLILQRICPFLLHVTVKFMNKATLLVS